MACNSGSCQSGCYRDGDVNSEHDGNYGGPVGNGEARNGLPQPGDDSNSSHLCIKCKVNYTIAAVSNGGLVGGDSRRFCADCFRGNIFGKFRFAVTSNAMIAPSDNVLVAFSGGPSSRVVLQFVHEMQDKAQKNFAASRDRSRPVFAVGVAFIDETAIYPQPSHEFDEAVGEMKQIVSNLGPPAKQFHVVHTESIYEHGAGRGRLQELIDTIPDVTGKEDFLEHLHILSLQKLALEHGYTKLVLGTCTSRIASRVLEATVKGKGFSLAADIQYVDARWQIPVLLPMRDCLSQELNLLCGLDSLKTVEVFKHPHSGINELVSSFVKLLQEENPSRESTIVRTAGKLTPFSFNKIEETDEQMGHLASQRRHKKYNLRPIESLPPESFCPLCYSPLNKAGEVQLRSFENCNIAGNFSAACSSCQYQILPKEPSSLKSFYSLLPEPISLLAKGRNLDNQRWLREQIEDCLLSDTEDVT